MRNFLLIALVLIFFSACTQKNSAFRYFDKGDLEANATRYTKKIDIVKDTQVDVIMMATYLNGFTQEKDLKEDSFLLYVYFSGKEEQDFIKNGYEILLNGKSPKSVEKLERDDKKYSVLMLKNFWGNYYLVQFDNQELVSRLNLTLKPKANDATLSFEKW